MRRRYVRIGLCRSLIGVVARCSCGVSRPFGSYCERCMLMMMGVVVGVKGLKVPMPREPTVISCTLNNGVHYVTTPECALSPDCMIDQEFEL